MEVIGQLISSRPANTGLHLSLRECTSRDIRGARAGAVAVLGPSHPFASSAPSPAP